MVFDRREAGGAKGGDVVPTRARVVRRGFGRRRSLRARAEFTREDRGAERLVSPKHRPDGPTSRASELCCASLARIIPNFGQHPTWRGPPSRAMWCERAVSGWTPAASQRAVPRRGRARRIYIRSLARPRVQGTRGGRGERRCSLRRPPGRGVRGGGRARPCGCALALAPSLALGPCPYVTCKRVPSASSVTV